MEATVTRLATTPRAARAVGVAVDWLKTEAQAGRVPCLLAGKNRYLFDVETLLQFLREKAKQLPTVESS